MIEKISPKLLVQAANKKHKLGFRFGKIYNTYVTDPDVLEIIKQNKEFKNEFYDLSLIIRDIIESDESKYPTKPKFPSSPSKMRKYIQELQIYKEYMLALLPEEYLKRATQNIFDTTYREIYGVLE